VLTMAVVHASDDADGSAAAGAAGSGAAALDPDSTAVLSVSLWRSEGLAGLVEVDGRLGISRAEPAAGLMFGVAHGQLLRKSFRRCARRGGVCCCFLLVESSHGTACWQK
jgi:hypothetical protein